MHDQGTWLGEHIHDMAKSGCPRSEMEVLRLCSGQEKQDARVEDSVRPQSSRGAITMFLVLFWSFSRGADPGRALVRPGARPGPQDGVSLTCSW